MLDVTVLCSYKDDQNLLYRFGTWYKCALIVNEKSNRGKEYDYQKRMQLFNSMKEIVEFYKTPLHSQNYP